MSIVGKQFKPRKKKIEQIYHRIHSSSVFLKSDFRMLMHFLLKSGMCRLMFSR